MIKVECEICKNTFFKKESLVKKYKTHFCNIKCAKIGKRTNLISTYCNQCNKIFYRKKSQIEKYQNNLCSKKCAHLLKTNIIPISTQNQIINDYVINQYSLVRCGKKYGVSSSKIKDILMKNNIKVKTPTEQRGLIRLGQYHKWRIAKKVKCKMCNKEFIYRKNSKTTYCSIKCRSSDNDLKDIIREHTLRQYESGNIKSSNTSIEIAIKYILNEMGVAYKHQFRLGRFIFDFKVQDSILIECDGDYWHSNPLFYNESNVNDKQKLIKNRDIMKNQIAKEQGYTLLRFWENDIKNNLQDIKNIIHNNICISA